MSKKKHRDRSWAPSPPALPVPVTDNHTHLVSVVGFSRQMDEQARDRGQNPVPVYSPDQLLSQAASAGVGRIIDVGCELPHLQAAVDLALAHSGQVYAALAIHPNEAVLHGHHGDPGPDGLEITYQPWHDLSFDEALSRVEQLARSNQGLVVAIGETGLDYYRTGPRARRLQIDAFRAHIDLAKELGLPLQIHDRNAHEDVVSTLLKDKAPEGTIFHSYSAGPEIAQIAREQGWYLSFSGTVSYKGNDRIRQALQTIDLHHILVETDAPYLSPMPYRGRTNAPYLIPYTLASMADTVDMPLEALAESVEENTRRVYHLPVQGR